MLNLEQLAKNVVDNWEKGDLASAVRALDVELKEIRANRKDHEETIETARKSYCTDDVEIDDDPMVSIGEDGVWVGAWVWVPLEKQERVKKT